MVAHTLWLWLSVGWLMTWLTEGLISPGSTSTCDLAPCRCTRSKLICDCTVTKVKDVMLKDIKELGFSISSISVANCNHVHVSSVSGLPALHQVSLTNIANLTLEEHSFSWTTDDSRHSGLAIDISHSLIPEIPSYTFRGCLKDVLLTDLNVSVTRPYAFSAIDHADKIHLTRVRFLDVNPQTFKKLEVDSLSVCECKFRTLPSRTMVDIQVNKDVVFDRLSIDAIRYTALKIHGPKKFQLSRSTINYMEKGALHIHTRGPASIFDNIFLLAEKGSFSKITVETRYLSESGKQDLSFENNTLINFENGLLTLNTTGFTPRLDTFLINDSCSCPAVDLWASSLTLLVGNVVYCVTGRSRTDLNTYRRLYCTAPTSNILLTLAFISFTVVTVSVLAVFVYCGFKERAKRYINVPNSPSPVKQNKDRILVVPDGKTYRETELHVIVEHAEPIVPTEYVLAPQD